MIKFNMYVYIHKSNVQKQVFITTEYINLGALLKYLGIIEQGSEAANFLATSLVLVNGVSETRRGRKIYPNDELIIGGASYLVRRKN